MYMIIMHSYLILEKLIVLKKLHCNLYLILYISKIILFKALISGFLSNMILTCFLLSLSE